ncbi:MAG: DUF1257 domain-containing protein [Planctomycetota bacterium]|nr:DUF1257 domain-containing protein [Planctomycetota bacterium]
MSSVCVLTPIVVGAWPSITAAVAGVAASMGFTVVVPENTVPERDTPVKRKVHAEIPDSEVLQDEFGEERIVIRQGDIEIIFERDHDGSLKLCVQGEKVSKAQLERIGQEVAGRVVQQFAYHKLITELKKRNYAVVDEHVDKDQSIQIRVRQGH